MLEKRELMNIGGISNSSSYSSYDGTAIADKSTREDPRIAGIKQQIMNKEQSIKNVENDNNLTGKEKTEKKKKLQDEITQLNQQLVELQKQIEKEEQEKKAEKEVSDEELEELQKTEKQKEIEKLSIPENLMETMVTAQTAMSQSGSLDWIKTKMEGEARTAASDAKRNAELGVDSSYLAGAAADAESAVDKITGMQLTTLGKASKEMEKSTEEQFEERQKKAAEERIHEKNEANDQMKSDNQTEQSIQDGTAGGNTIVTDEAAEEADTDTASKSSQIGLTISDEDSKKYLDQVVYREIDVLL